LIRPLELALDDPPKVLVERKKEKRVKERKKKKKIKKKKEKKKKQREKHQKPPHKTQHPTINNPQKTSEGAGKKVAEDGPGPVETEGRGKDPEALSIRSAQECAQGQIIESVLK